MEINGINAAIPEKWRLVKEKEEHRGRKLIGAII